MVIMIVRMKFAPALEKEFLRTLGEYVSMLQRRYEWRLHSSLKTQIGDLHEVTNLWQFEGLGDFWACRTAMLVDEDYLLARSALHGLMVDEQLSFASPLPWSPPTGI